MNIRVLLINKTPVNSCLRLPALLARQTGAERTGRRELLQRSAYAKASADKSSGRWDEIFMKKSGRYKTTHLIEDQPEPGSRGRVLKNKLGITSKREMDRGEKAEQIRTIEELTNIFGVDHRFTASDICKIHKIWLAGNF